MRRLSNKDMVKPAFYAACYTLKQRVSLNRKLANHDVVSPFHPQQWYILGTVLKVVIHGKHIISLGDFDAAQCSRLLAKITHQIYRPHAGIISHQSPQVRPSLWVGRRIVHEDNLIFNTHRLKGSSNTLDQPCQRLYGIVNRHNNGERFIHIILLSEDGHATTKQHLWVTSQPHQQRNQNP